MSKSEAKFPKKLKFLFAPVRYKGARGGRGSAKSWGFARALLIIGASRKVRILCTREIQKSIRDSVHRLLKDQIELLGLSHFYEVLNNEIRGKNGTEFLFAGLSNLTVESIKSYEGVDIVWCEEAQVISSTSWKILIPTIRKPGSEIWLTFNPELETDYTYEYFVTHAPEDSEIVEMNYLDNPWFPEVLEKERLHCLATNPKDYPNIWEGKCKPAVTGAIYYEEVQKAEENRQICNIPYDSMLKVHVVFDLGWNDAMAISLVQRSLSEIRIIEYMEDSHKTLEYYSNLLKTKTYNWGKVWLPHDGNHKDIKTGKSAKQYMESFGWDVEITQDMSVEAGIRNVRQVFPRIYFDKTEAKGLLHCAKRYRRRINKETNEPGQPLHDEWSHGADNLRYVCINAEKMTNSKTLETLNFASEWSQHAG